MLYLVTISIDHPKNTYTLHINANHLAEVGISNELKSICKIIEISSEVIKYQFKSCDYEEVINLLKRASIPFKTINFSEGQYKSSAQDGLDCYDDISSYQQPASIERLDNTTISLKIDYKLAKTKKVLQKIKYLSGALWSKIDKRWTIDHKELSKLISILSENNVAFRLDGEFNMIGDIEQHSNKKPIANIKSSTQIEKILIRIDQMEKDQEYLTVDILNELNLARDYNNILISNMQTKLDQLEKSFAKLTISTPPLQSIQLKKKRF
jgi:hypothetical protein